MSLTATIRPYASLSAAERTTLQRYLHRHDAKRFADLAAVQETYAHGIFEHGQQHFSLWRGDAVRGTLAVVTRELPIKQEAYLVGAYAEPDEAGALAALVGQAMACCRSSSPFTVRLGLTPGHDHLAAEAAALGFAEVELALEMTHTGAGPAIAPDPTLRFEPVTPENAEDFRQVLNAAFRHAPNGATLTPEEVAAMREERQPADLLGVGYRGTTPVGIYELSLADGVGQIESIGVAPACHGQGLGKQLVRQAVSVLQGLGATRVQLMVMSSNTQAVALYRKYGFGDEVVTGRWFERRDPANA